MENSTYALKDILVLDLSRVLAGPLSTQILADMGAHVIKVERPGTGDDTRAWGPPFVEETHDANGNGKVDRLSAYYLCANRGKQSIAVNFATPEGQKIIRSLAEKADIIVENFVPGKLKKYGLDYDQLKEINPKLIYCSITGFGQYGDLANHPGYDLLVQAMSGLMSITGIPDPANPQEGHPTKIGVPMCDILTGMNGVIGILAALHKRERTGTGERVNVNLFESALSALSNQGSTYLTSGQIPQQIGNAHPTIVPYEPFPCADGQIIIAVGNDTQFRHLCERLGHPSWASDERFHTNEARVTHRVELESLIANTLKQKPCSHWLQQLEKAGIPCGQINDIGQAYELKHTKERETVQTLTKEGYGPIRLVRSPIRMENTKTTSDIPPPEAGEDTDSILKTHLKMDTKTLKKLRDHGVIE